MKKEKLIGTWKFKSMKFETEKGEVIYPYGEKLFGMLIYTRCGHMSVLLMNPDRQKFASDDPFGGTQDEIKTAYKNFDAYCGTYSIDEEKETVTHHIEGSKLPNWVGTKQVRYFKLSDDKLLLYATLKAKGTQWKAEAILKRLLRN
jgi:hypothetical protein